MNESDFYHLFLLDFDSDNLDNVIRHTIIDYIH